MLLQLNSSKSLLMVICRSILANSGLEIDCIATEIFIYSYWKKYDNEWTHISMMVTKFQFYLQIIIYYVILINFNEIYVPSFTNVNSFISATSYLSPSLISSGIISHRHL